MRSLSILCVLCISIVPNILHAVSDGSSSSYDQSSYEQKKLATQDSSTKMRREYYEKYKAKWGYDMSLLSPDILDGRITEEYRFWEALKKMQNLKEIPERKTYVEKLKKSWVDTSVFTDAVIADAGKFWELYKKLEPTASYKKPVEEIKTKEYPKPVSAEAPEKIMHKDRAITLFVARLDKIDPAKLPETLQRLETNITKQITIAKSKWLPTLEKRLTTMLSIVRERMDTTTDESFIDTLFY
jgi:hypothetical protein